MLSDHIKQDIFLAFQTGGCLLLHETSAEQCGCQTGCHLVGNAQTRNRQEVVPLVQSIYKDVRSMVRVSNG